MLDSTEDAAHPGAADQAGESALDGSERQILQVLREVEAEADESATDDAVAWRPQEIRPHEDEQQRPEPLQDLLDNGRAGVGSQLMRARGGGAGGQAVHE